MTAYEIISIFIGILMLLFTFGSLIRCLAFSTEIRITSEKNNAPPV